MHFWEILVVPSYLVQYLYMDQIPLEGDVELADDIVVQNYQSYHFVGPGQGIILWEAMKQKVLQPKFR